MLFVVILGRESVGLSVSGWMTERACSASSALVPIRFGRVLWNRAGFAETPERVRRATPARWICPYRATRPLLTGAGQTEPGNILSPPSCAGVQHQPLYQSGHRSCATPNAREQVSNPANSFLHR